MIIIDHHAQPAAAETGASGEEGEGEGRRLPPNTRELWCGNTGANTTLLVEKLMEKESK